MDRQTEEDLLRKLTSGGIPYSDIFPTEEIWPELLDMLIARLDKIVASFPIPDVPPPPAKLSRERRLPSPIASSDVEPSSSADANKENTDPRPSREAPAPVLQGAELTRQAARAGDRADGSSSGDDGQVEAGRLPPQIGEMVDEIVRTMRGFPKHPPHTMQRIAELLLEPKHHYRALASYLHALDRVVHVTSSSNRYPLSAAAEMTPNGVVEAVSWGNTVNATATGVATDEALGGAVLVPIPWLTEKGASSSGGNSGASQQQQKQKQQDRRPELRTESTETIEGPNGVGSIETVTISVNGMMSVSSTSGVTMRPVAAASHHDGSEGSEGSDPAEEDDEEPQVRGPDEISARDLGPHAQTVNISQDKVPGLQPQDIDIDAALGRKADAVDDDDEMGDVEARTKRGPDHDLDDGVAHKKTRSENGDQDMEDDAGPTTPPETVLH